MPVQRKGSAEVNRNYGKRAIYFSHEFLLTERRSGSLYGQQQMVSSP